MADTPLNSAACEICTLQGKSTAVEWEGPMGEQAVQDMRGHIREAHMPFSLRVEIRDDNTTFGLGDD